MNNYLWLAFISCLLISSASAAPIAITYTYAGTNQRITDIITAAITFFQSFLDTTNTVTLTFVDNPSSSKTTVDVTAQANASPNFSGTIDFYGLAGITSTTPISDYQFHKLARATVHCILKIIAFQSTVFTATAANPTKNVISTFNTYFPSCTLPFASAKTVTQGAFTYWDAGYLYQDLMTYKYETDEKALSVFNIALLKDMGITVNESYAEPITVPSSCPTAASVNNMACNSSNQNTKCNTSLTAKSKCKMLDASASSIASTSVSDFVYQPDTDGSCLEPDLNTKFYVDVFTYGSAELRSYQSRCFTSDIKLSTGIGYQDPTRCYKYTCDSSNTITIYLDTLSTGNIVGIDTVQCTTSLQGYSVTLKNAKYTSTTGLTCPTDNKSFCQSKLVMCKNFCNQKGVCVNQKCLCSANSYGNDCSCNGSTPFQENSVCVTACSTKKIGVNNICQDRCLSNYYYDGTSCKQCSFNCLTCWTTKYTCDSCNTGYTLHAGSCVLNPSTSCSVGSYYDTTASLCKPCNSNCSTCFYESTYCLSCKSTFYLTSTNICSTCTPYCDVCTATGCQTCSTGYFLKNDKSGCLDTCDTGYFLSNGACIMNCPSGQYGDTATKSCLNCDSTCLTCQAPAAVGVLLTNSCTSCTQDRKLSGLNVGSCNLICVDGTGKQTGIYIQDVLITPATPTLPYWSYKCASCSDYVSHCTYCSGTTQTCLECVGPTAAVGSTPATLGYVMYKNHCIDVCPSGYFNDSVSKACKACDTMCGTCSQSGKCITCADGLYIQLDMTCLSKCPIGFKENPSSMTCVFQVTATDDEDSGMINCFRIVLLLTLLFVAY